jgi:hypothetical protein
VKSANVLLEQVSCAFTQHYQRVARKASTSFVALKRGRYGPKGPASSFVSTVVRVKMSVSISFSLCDWVLIDQKKLSG